MGSFMSALDREEQDSEATALRFMRATRPERQLLNGIAAVYLSKGGEYAEPVPSRGRSATSFRFRRLDGFLARRRPPGIPGVQPGRRHPGNRPVQ